MVTIILTVLFIIFFILDVTGKIKNTAMLTGLVYVLSLPLIIAFMIPVLLAKSLAEISGAFIAVNVVLPLLLAVPALILMLIGCVRICRKPVDNSGYSTFGYSDGGYGKDCAKRLLILSLTAAIAAVICASGVIGGLVKALEPFAGVLGEYGEIITPSGIAAVLILSAITLGIFGVIFFITVAASLAEAAAAAAGALLAAGFSGVIFAVLMLAAVIFGICALWRMMKLKVNSGGKTFLFILSLFVPVLNIVTLIVMLSKLNKFENSLYTM